MEQLEAARRSLRAQGHNADTLIRAIIFLKDHQRVVNPIPKATYLHLALEQATTGLRHATGSGDEFIRLRIEALRRHILDCYKDVMLSLLQQADEGWRSAFAKAPSRRAGVSARALKELGRLDIYDLRGSVQDRLDALREVWASLHESANSEDAAG